MTSRRIAKVFQPVILSPVKASEYFIEIDPYSELSQQVLTFLIEIHGYYLAKKPFAPVVCIGHAR